MLKDAHLNAVLLDRQRVSIFRRILLLVITYGSCQNVISILHVWFENLMAEDLGAFQFATITVTCNSIPAIDSHICDWIKQNESDVGNMDF